MIWISRVMLRMTLLSFCCAPVFGDFVDLLQWCNDFESGWISYNSSTAACFTCGGKSFHYIDRSVLKPKVCCFTGLTFAITERSECQDWPRDEDRYEVCENGYRVKESEVCNGFNNCGDGYDESLCNQCIGQFRCSTAGGQCFPLDKVCDGNKDCTEGSDEMNCIYHKGRCDNFLCSTFQECIPPAKVCDGVKDCLDGSDEVGCSNFRCNTAASLNGSEIKVCDGRPDCPDGYDELSCPIGEPTRFRCNMSITVDEFRVCDGNIDCIVDGLDENNCFTWSPWSSWTRCHCLVSDPQTRKRERKCITFQSFIHHSGKCGEGNVSQIDRCTCPTTTVTTFTVTHHPNHYLGIQWVVVIVLASSILVLLFIGVVYGATFSRRANVQVEKQASIVADINNVSVQSLSPTGITEGYNGYRLTVNDGHPRGGFSAASRELSQSSPAQRDIPLPMSPGPFINEEFAPAHCGVAALANHTYESINELHSRRPVQNRELPTNRYSVSSATSDENFEETGCRSETVVETYCITAAKEIGYSVIQPKPPVRVEQVDKDGYLLPMNFKAKGESRRTRRQEEDVETAGQQYVSMRSLSVNEITPDAGRCGPTSELIVATVVPTWTKTLPERTHSLRASPKVVEKSLNARFEGIGRITSSLDDISQGRTKSRLQQLSRTTSV